MAKPIQPIYRTVLNIRRLQLSNGQEELARMEHILPYIAKWVKEHDFNVDPEAFMQGVEMESERGSLESIRLDHPNKNVFAAKMIENGGTSRTCSSCRAMAARSR